MQPATLLSVQNGAQRMVCKAMPSLPSVSRPRRKLRTSRRNQTRKTAAAASALPSLRLVAKSKPSLKSKLKSAADSVAVETLPNFGPVSHGLTQEQLLEDADEQHSSDENTSSFSQALCNAVNILMGVGLLSIPFALKEGGWASLGVLAAIWTGTNYTGKILIKCQEVDRQKTLQNPNSNATGLGKLLTSYEDVGERAFGQPGRQFITTVLYAELLGTCTLFYILFGDHMHFLLSQVLGPLMDIPSKEQLMAMSAALFIPTTWLPDLNALSSFGILGMMSSIGVTGLVLYELIQHGANWADTIPIDMVTLPGSFGLLAFVFAGHAVFPSIYSSMKDKDKFPKMLNTSYMIVGATCLFMGVAGYLLYGSNTLEEITLNLPSGMLSLAATSLILVSPFAKFGLTLEPVARGVDKKLNLSMRNSTSILARVNRTALGCGCLFMATQIPFFGQFMSVVGSFLTLTISVIFPSLCYMKLYGADLKSTEKLMNYSVVALGVACAVSGTWTAVNEVIKQMN
eukprot:g6367.t1